MILSAIAAMAHNRVIGCEGGLPWRIPEDMRFFKEKTAGHALIMGRKTFDSFGGKLLPGRLHVVITRDKAYRPPKGCEAAVIVASPREAVDYCATKTGTWGEEVFIVGGGEIYKMLLPLTKRIYLTEIKQDFEGDALFPEIDRQQFDEVGRLPRTKPIPFDFVIYERRI